MTTLKTFVSSLLVISVLISTGHPVCAAGAGTQGTRSSAPARASTTQQPADGGWPRAYLTPSGARLVIYEPQIASWLDQKRMAMYAAVSYTPADQTSTALGTINAEANTKISVPERLVSFSDPTITSANFPTLSGDHQLSNVVSEVNAAVPREERVIGLDRVLAAFDASQVKPQNVKGKDVKAALGARHAGTAAGAPTVFVSRKPAELMLLNGVAAYKPVTGTHLEWVSNTDSDVFRLGTTGTVYYFPHYPTYGYGARYNPWTGVYTRGGAVYGPYGGAGYAARYNPRTGMYARGAAAWGPGGARGGAQAWDPRTGTSAQTRQGANVFGSWGATAVQRGDQWARIARVTNRATGATTRATGTSGGGGFRGGGRGGRR